jgi:tetratricopeptide (TPR) repeat protein
MVHKKQLSYTKRLTANKIIDLIYGGKLTAASALVKKNYRSNTELYHFFTGWIEQLSGEHIKSIRSFERALIINPLNEEVLIGLAGSYLELGDFERAEECASHALTINKNDPKACLTLATVLSKSSPTNKQVQKQADSMFERAFDLYVNSLQSNNKLLVDILAGWGGCLLNLEELDQAKIVLEKAIANDRYNPVAHKNLVSVYASLNMVEEAIQSCKIAQMSSDKSMVIDTVYQEGMLEILKGNYAKGWRLHEARLESARYKYLDLLSLSKKNFSELTPQDSILIFQEQGIGDLLQFLHLIPEVHKRCPTIDIVVLPNTFLKMNGGQVPSPKEFVINNLKNYVRKVYIKNVDTIPKDYDCAVSVMSLGFHLKLRPDNNTGILPFTAEPLNKYSGRVGLFWKGSEHHANDSTRSVPTEYINNLIVNNSDIRFVSLQIDRDEELVDAENVVSAKSDMQGLLETCKVIQDCSLVVSVDSMIAHLAAGLGKPVLMLHSWSPDWRWGLSGEKNRWYATVTDIRQSSYKDWNSVFSSLNNRLEVFKMFID